MSNKFSAGYRAGVENVERDLPAWRPIETAPKDGTKIDVWVAHFIVKAGKLHREDVGYRITDAWWGKPYYGDDRKWETQWVWNDGGPWHDPIELGTTSVTHWMPLPEPPK